MTLFQKVCLIAATILCIGLSSNVLAITLDEAKARGLLGELPNGYLGVVSPPGSSDVRDLQRTINQKRRSKYQEIANGMERTGSCRSACRKNCY